MPGTFDPAILKERRDFHHFPKKIIHTMSNAILPARSCKHGKCLINLGNNFGSIILKVINNNIQFERSDIFIKSFSNNAFVSMISQLNEKKKYGCIESGNKRPINTYGRTVVVFEHLHTPKRLKNHNKSFKNKNKEKHLALEECTEMAQGKDIGNNNESMLKQNTKHLFETRTIDYTDKKVMTRKLELVRTFSKQVHGKMSIIFKQSYKFKSDECSSTNRTLNLTNSINFNDSNFQTTGSQINLCNLVRDENITNLENSKPSKLSEGNSIDIKENRFPVIKMAKLLNAKNQNAPTDYVGKMKILFNHSGRYKTSVLPSSNHADSDIERQNKDKECSVYSTEHKSKNDLIFLEGIGSVPKKIVQHFMPLLKNMTYSQKPSSFDNSKPLESGKMKINFNHSTKTKSFNKVGNVLVRNDASKQDNDNVYSLTNTEETNTELHSQPENKLAKNDTFIDASAHDFSGCNMPSNTNTMNSCTLQGQESKVAEIPESKREIFQVEKICNFNAETMRAQNQKDANVNNLEVNKINTSVHKVKYLPKKIKKSKLKSKRKLPPSATRIALEKSKQSLDRLIMFNSDPQCGFITGTSDKIKTVEDMVEGTKPRKVEKQGLKEKFIVQKFDGNIEKMSETENKIISQGEESFDKKKTPSECKTEKNNLKAINKCHSENNFQFTNLLSNPHEIGIMTINSTRTAEPIESNDDTNFYKRIFTVTNTLKKVVKKKTPNNKMTENKSFPSVEAVNKEDMHNEDKLKNEKQLDLFQTDPLGCKPFLKSVSNFLEVIQINEFIDDIIKTPGHNMKPGVCTTQNKTKPGISKEKNKIIVTKCKSAQLDVPPILDKRIFQLGHNKITITEISKTDAFPPPVVKVQNCDVGNNPSQMEQSTKKQVQAVELELPKGMKHSPLKENVSAQDSTKENDPNCSTISKIRKNATTKMINHFESLQGVIDFPQGTKIVKNVVKDRMQAYQDISKKFEKMGLYRKVPKKKLMEEIEDSRKNSLATIKRDLELQDKYKNTPKGKRMQEYFHSFKFRLTSTMKEYGKRKNLKNNKKMLISSKLGKLNPQTSPSKPSFARKGNRKNKYV